LPPQGAKAILSPSRGYSKTGPSGPGFLFCTEKPDSLGLWLGEPTPRRARLEIDSSALEFCV
jgi:hypothetical protein